jgi:hypothetical protein
MNSYYYISESEKEKMKKKKFENKLFIQNLNKKNFFKDNNNKSIEINKNKINQNSYSKYSIYSSNRNNNLTNYSTYYKLPNINNSSYSFINKDSRNYSQNVNKTDYNITPFNEKDSIDKNKYKIIKLNKKENKYLKNFNFIKKPTLLTLTLKTFVEKQKCSILKKKTFENLEKLLPINLINMIKFERRFYDKKRISFVAPFNKKLFQNYVSETMQYSDEKNDKVDELLNEKHELYSILRLNLINDINNTNNKDNTRLFNNIENLFNFKYDICIYPQLKNNFLFIKYNYIDDKITKKKLCDKNCLSKEVSISLNKSRMNKFLGINDDIYKLNYQDIIKASMKNISSLDDLSFGLLEKYFLEEIKKYKIFEDEENIWERIKIIIKQNEI